MITSLTNPKVKLVGRLLRERRTRQRENAFVAEGTRWLEDIDQTRYRPHFWLATPEWQEKNQALAESLIAQGIPPLLIDPLVAKKIADTETPSGVFAVLPLPDLPWPITPKLLLILDGLQDPGNMGTLFRSATAAGVDGVLLLPGSVDPFNPKVTRSTMGTLLRLPLRQTTWETLPTYTDSCHIFLATGDSSTPYTTIDWTAPSALIVGNEAHGASSAARHAAQTSIYIPMQRNTESLNAAVAGSIILFEAVRQIGSAPRSSI